MCIYTYKYTVNIYIYTRKNWALKGPKRPKKQTKRPENSENMTFRKVEKSAPGEDSGRTATWKILRG